MKKIYGKNKLSNSDRWIENAEKRQISALLLYKMAAKQRSKSAITAKQIVISAFLFS